MIRLSLFLSIAVCVICLTLNLLLWPQRWWSLFVLAGIGAGWATVAQAIRKRSSFCKHVLYQVVTVGIVVVLFDLMTGFGHWSFNYVIPALCVFAMVVIAIIAAMGHRSISNYIIYMVVSAVFGLIPLLFLLPLLWMISGSLKTPLTIFDYPIKWIPESLSWLVRRSGHLAGAAQASAHVKKNRTAPKWAQSGFFSSDYRVIQ